VDVFVEFKKERMTFFRMRRAGLCWCGLVVILVLLLFPQAEAPGNMPEDKQHLERNIAGVLASQPLCYLFLDELERNLDRLREQAVPRAQWAPYFFLRAITYRSLAALEATELPYGGLVRLMELALDDLQRTRSLVKEQSTSVLEGLEKEWHAVYQKFRTDRDERHLRQGIPARVQIWLRAYSGETPLAPVLRDLLRGVQKKRRISR
jgi:hypothetical protein